MYENAYVRDGGARKIWRLDYSPIWRADYALGWSHARPRDVAPFSRTLRPRIDVATFRHPHPVTRNLWEG